MPTINLVRPIKLNLDDGQQLSLPAGPVVVSDDVASHWFVKASIAPEVDPSALVVADNDHQEMADLVIDLQGALDKAHAKIDDLLANEENYQANLKNAASSLERLQGEKMAAEEKVSELLAKIKSLETSPPAPLESEKTPPTAATIDPARLAAIALLTVPQLREAITEKGGTIPANAQKADLVELLKGL